MALPGFQTLMLPLLRLLADGRGHTKKDLHEALARHFRLTEGDLRETLSGGHQSTFTNRFAWAQAYLKMAGLLDSPAKGQLCLTAAGAKVLGNPPGRLDLAFLKTLPTFLQDEEEAREEPRTPEEQMEAAYAAMRAALAQEVLEQVRRCTPSFFERLVVRLLVAMGYGGSAADAAQTVGGTGDGGIDGIIKEDMLGFGVICVQAKRWSQAIGSPEVQAFAGSMEAHHARKGVFLTTSHYTAAAKKYAQSLGRKVVLIDGPRLAELMIEHAVGVTLDRSYEVKRLDPEFFSDEPW